MNLRRTLLIPSLALGLMTSGCGVQKPWSTVHAASKTPLETVLEQLDAASKTFKSAQADLKQDIYTRAVRADDIDTGSVFFERSGSGQNMGVAIFEPGPDGKPTKSPSKIYLYDGATFQLYTPGLNQVDVYQAGANQSKYESFLTLGFGGSGTALAKAWKITDQGPETIDGVKTEKLDLVSKDPNVTNLFTHITINIDPARGVSLKQVFFAPNGDIRTTNYTNIRLNASINKHPYAISGKATRIQH